MASPMSIMVPLPEGASDERVEVDEGVHLRVVRCGDGAPVVFVPGWTCTADFFAHQLSGLSDDHHVVSYDPRGHGGSDKPLSGHSFADRGTDLAALLQNLDLTGAVVVGWAFGAYDMFSFLRDHDRSRVAGVVVLDGPPRVWIDPDEPHAWGEAPLAADGIVAFLRGVIEDRPAYWKDYAAYMIDLAEDEDPDEDDDVARIVELGMQCPDVVAVATMADGLTSDFTGTAGEVAAELPTLVLARADWADGAEAWVQEYMKGAEFGRVPTHMAFATHPDEVNQRIREFAASVRVRTDGDGDGEGEGEGDEADV